MENPCEETGADGFFSFIEDTKKALFLFKKTLVAGAVRFELAKEMISRVRMQTFRSSRFEAYEITSPMYEQYRKAGILHSLSESKSKILKFLKIDIA